VNRSWRAIAEAFVVRDIKDCLSFVAGKGVGLRAGDSTALLPRHRRFRLGGVW
jgi:hypothetical protein